VPHAGTGTNSQAAGRAAGGRGLASILRAPDDERSKAVAIRRRLLSIISNADDATMAAQHRRVYPDGCGGHDGDGDIDAALAQDYRRRVWSLIEFDDASLVGLFQHESADGSLGESPPIHVPLPPSDRHTEGQAAAYRNALGYFVHGPYCVPTDKAGDALMHLVNEHSERGEWEAADRLLASGFRLSVACAPDEAVRVTSFVVSKIPGEAYASYDADAGRVVFWRGRHVEDALCEAHMELLTKEEPTLHLG